MKLHNKKTGEVVEADYISVARSGFDVVDKDGNIIAKDIHTLPLCYLSVRELTSEFEDYKPSEPLIKDEKIRKAVRAWAWANNIDEIDHWQGQLTGRKAGCSRGRAKIQFNRALGFNYGCGFTIAELCGEKEE